MLHARACENQQRKSSSPTQLSSQRRQETHFPWSAGSELPHLQNAYGNQAILRMLDGFSSRFQGRLADAQGTRVSSQIRVTGAGQDAGVQPAVPPAKAPAAPVSPAPPHPFTAFLTLSRVSDPTCSIPPGQFGAAKVGSYRLVDANGQAVTSKVTITEQFTKLDGPDEIYKLLSPNTYDATKGAFDDCYSMHSHDELPDFRLKVEQNHLVGGEIISKNHITYSPLGITICAFSRKAQGWSDNCKRF